MAYKTPTDLDDKYYDDFDDNKNFVQILFNPGRPVQARELTQLQSILQNQISKFSDSIYQDGAIVFGCKVNLFTYGFLRVKASTILNSIGAQALTLAGQKDDAACREIFFKSQNNKIIGKTFVPIVGTIGTTDYTSRSIISALDDDFQIEIEDILPATSTDDIILIYRFIKGSTSHIKNFLINAATTLKLQEVTSTNYSTLSAINRGVVNTNPITFEITPSIYKNNDKTSFSNILVENVEDLKTVNVTSGIVYKDGKFVNVEESNIILYKLSETSGLQITTEYTQSFSWKLFGNVTLTTVDGATSGYGRKLFGYPTKSVGFLFDYQYITSTEDTSLNDNASGFTNARAPGADRLKFDISIEQYDVNISAPTFPSNYNEVIRVRGGIIDKITTNIEKQYSEILKLFAKRTFDESGSYTVTPFKLTMKEHLRYNYFNLVVNADFVPGNFPEIGDLVYAALDNTDSVLSTNLIFDSETETGTLKKANFYTTRRIGEIVDVGTRSILIKQLTPQSWSSLNDGDNITKKSANGDEEITFELSSTPEYRDGNDGVYTVYDTPAGDADKFVISISGGKAYVNGFEYETELPNNIEANKARGPDHLKSTTTTIFCPLENTIIVEAANTIFNTEVSGFHNKIIDICADAVGLNFLSNQSDTASGEILDWVPFYEGVSVNTSSSDTIVSYLNKQSVIFITDENAPL